MTNLPMVTLNCPPGLEYLATIDQLLVKAKIKLARSILGYGTNNKYLIKNNEGQDVYVSVEETHWLTRYFLGTTRPFKMKIVNNADEEVGSMLTHVHIQTRANILDHSSRASEGLSRLVFSMLLTKHRNFIPTWHCDRSNKSRYGFFHPTVYSSKCGGRSYIKNQGTVLYVRRCGI
jgi:hypothetical protein